MNIIFSSDFSDFLKHHMDFVYILLNLAAFNLPLRNFQTPCYNRFPGMCIHVGNGVCVCDL